ncbi:MAG: nucleoside deaminase [Saprospiraceae bacterium]|nr:nucleoside deaminase [Bacteroidia bacterium]NNE15601.1 nucleoside deaminase [Saprospiraceae bacterium]NNL93696.1 nucleoside deaminase [Saprospiraceae bacterium]
MLSIYTDDYFMKKALDEAHQAYDSGEVPVGAVIVCNNVIIAKAHNQVEQLKDITAHAEILAITAASNYLGSKFLEDCTMYVTLEPCHMCAGASKWARLGRIVYGTSDDKAGFMKHGKELLHPTTKLEYGVMNDECSAIIKSFFKKLR